MQTPNFYQTTRLKVGQSYTRQKLIVGACKLIKNPDLALQALKSLIRLGLLEKVSTNDLGCKNLDCYLLKTRFDENGQPY